MTAETAMNAHRGIPPKSLANSGRGQRQGEKKGAHTRTPNPNRETKPSNPSDSTGHKTDSSRLAGIVSSMPRFSPVLLMRVKANACFSCFFAKFNRMSRSSRLWELDTLSGYASCRGCFPHGASPPMGAFGFHKCLFCFNSFWTWRGLFPAHVHISWWDTLKRNAYTT